MHPDRIGQQWPERLAEMQPGLQAGEVLERRGQIDQLDERARDPARSAGVMHDQRVAQQDLVETRRPFLYEPVVAEVLTVIGEEERHGPVRLAGVVHGCDDLAELLVDAAHHRVVRAGDLGPVVDRHAVEAIATVDLPVETRLAVEDRRHRRRHLYLAVPLVPRALDRERWMREHQRDEEAPRLGETRAQPVDRCPHGCCVEVETAHRRSDRRRSCCTTSNRARTAIDANARRSSRSGAMVKPN